jgi:surfeit locus 1 family protein
MKLRAMLIAVLVLAGVALCARLGLWQLSRWQYKRALNARLAEAERLPPLRALRAPPFAQVRGRYLELPGRYDERAQVVIGGHLRQDVPGIEVITPLVLEDGTAVLVNRGWVPVAAAGPVSLAPYDEPGPRRVTGYPESLLTGRRSPPLAVRTMASGTVYWSRDLDLDTLAARLPYALAPYVLRQAPGPGVPAQPLRTRPEPWDEGMHLGYAVQWFSFALILLGGSIWLAFLRARAPAGPPISSRPAPPISSGPPPAA